MENSKRVQKRITGALLSVYDKTDIVEFARFLEKMGIVIYSSGGTYLFLAKSGINAVKIEELTHYREILEGRVKTLHPAIHGSILYRRDKANDRKTIKNYEMVDLSLVVVDLYPFEKVARTGKLDAIIENIDIGGVALLRAAAKNHKWVTVLSDPKDYDLVKKELTRKKNTELETRKRLAIKAFQTTARYDQCITSFFQKHYFKENNLQMNFTEGEQLPYGENPHQKAWLYRKADGDSKSSDTVGPVNRQPLLTDAEILHGKPMSYNNYLDAESALACVWDLYPNKAVAVIKHQNPCGLATGSVLPDCLEKAWEGDSVSSFGSIIATNQTFDYSSTRFLHNKFIEVLIAPDFEPNALQWLKKQNKNLRIIKTPKAKVLTANNLMKVKSSSQREDVKEYKYHFITGGLLVQEKDHKLYDKLTSVGYKRKGKFDIDFYEFAFRTVKYIKSNAISICYSYRPGYYMVLGIGCGQPNRIDAISKLALSKATENLSRFFPNLPEQERTEILSECILASDGFFPFTDSIDIAYKHGIRKIIQPGGSIRDNEVIARAKELKIEMLFSSTRHFLH